MFEACAINAALKKSDVYHASVHKSNTGTTLDQDELVQGAFKLIQLLRFEFDHFKKVAAITLFIVDKNFESSRCLLFVVITMMLKPCENVYFKVIESLNSFTSSEILVDYEQLRNRPNEHSRYVPLRSLRQYAFDDDEDDDEYGSSGRYTADAAKSRAKQAAQMARSEHYEVDEDDEVDDGVALEPQPNSAADKTRIEYDQDEEEMINWKSSDPRRKRQFYLVRSDFFVLLFSISIFSFSIHFDRYKQKTSAAANEQKFAERSSLL